VFPHEEGGEGCDYAEDACTGGEVFVEGGTEEAEEECGACEGVGQYAECAPGSIAFDGAERKEAGGPFEEVVLHEGGFLEDPDAKAAEGELEYDLDAGGEGGPWIEAAPIASEGGDAECEEEEGKDANPW
jgi:hypothetical protein